MVSKLDILRLFSGYEDDIDLADFSPDELYELLKEAEARGERAETAAEFKEKYFSYYDDVKDKSLKKQDW